MGGGFFCCCSQSDDKEDDEDLSGEFKYKNTLDLLSNNNDLTKDQIQCDPIQELKSKLEAKDLLVDNKQDDKEEEEVDAEDMIPESQRGVPLPPPPPALNHEGLIIPRKLHNPVQDNMERQNLHRELLFNQKIGKNVLNQKSELQKAMQKHKDNIAKKEIVNGNESKKSELIKVIEDRAKRLEEVQTPTQNEDDKGLNNVFVQARARLKTRADSK